MKGQKTLFSRKSDDWKTPSGVYEPFNAIYHFNFDPCPLRSKIDFLSPKRAWKGNVFINPPYSKIRLFLEKGLFELQQKHVKILVYLLPSRSDTKWFHEIILPLAQKIIFIKGRLKFNGHANSAPFPSMVVIFR